MNLPDCPKKLQHMLNTFAVKTINSSSHYYHNIGSNNGSLSMSHDPKPTKVSSTNSNDYFFPSNPHTLNSEVRSPLCIENVGLQKLPCCISDNIALGGDIVIWEVVSLICISQLLCFSAFPLSSIDFKYSSQGTRDEVKQSLCGIG